MTEDDMVVWHHQLHGHGSQQTLEDSEGRGSLSTIVHEVLKSQTCLNNRTTTKVMHKILQAKPQ